MIGTSGATVLFVVNVLFGFTCFALRRPWGLKAALIDAVLAAVVAIIAAYVVSAIEIRRGVWESRVTLVLVIAPASVVLRHVVWLLFRSPSH